MTAEEFSVDDFKAATPAADEFSVDDFSPERASKKAKLTGEMAELRAEAPAGRGLDLAEGLTQGFANMPANLMNLVRAPMAAVGLAPQEPYEAGKPMIPAIGDLARSVGELPDVAFGAGVRQSIPGLAGFPLETLGGVGKGLTESALGTVESFTTPEMLMVAGTGAAGGGGQAINRALTGAFVEQMGSQIPEAVIQAHSVITDPEMPLSAKVKAGADVTALGVMTGLAGGHLLAKAAPRGPVGPLEAPGAEPMPIPPVDPSAVIPPTVGENILTKPVEFPVAKVPVEEPVPVEQSAPPALAVPEAKPERTPDASRIQTPAEVHGDVQPPAVEGQGQVPTEVGGERVQPPVQEAKGEVPLTGGAPQAPKRGEIGAKLAPGEVVTTASGRQTTPFPKGSVETNRKATAWVKRVEAWLHENAVAEAESRGDKFNLGQFKGENPAKLTQATKDSMEEYLFGSEQPPVPEPILKPINPPEPPSVKWGVTQDGQPYGLFASEAQARMVASALSGEVEVKPIRMEAKVKEGLPPKLEVLPPAEEVAQPIVELNLQRAEMEKRPSLERAMEMERDFGLSAPDAHFFNVALDAVRANPEKWSTLAEGIQKEAMKSATAARGNYIKTGDLKLAKQIAEKYLGDIQKAPAGKARAAREFKLRPKVERHPLIDWIKSHFPQGVKISSKADYGDMLQNRKGIARKLLSQSKGESADRVLQAMAERGEHGYSGGKIETEDQLIQAILDASTGNMGDRAQAKTEAKILDTEAAKAEEFGKIALDNQGRDAVAKAKAKPFPIDELQVGSKFTLKGEPFTVTEIDPDTGAVTVDDGKKFERQVLGSEGIFHPDDGVVEHPAGESTDFLPPEEPEKPAPAETVEDPFSLTGEEPSKPEIPKPEPIKPDFVEMGMGLEEAPKPKPTAEEVAKPLSAAERREFQDLEAREAELRNYQGPLNERPAGLNASEHARLSELMRRSGQKSLLATEEIKNTPAQELALAQRELAAIEANPLRGNGKTAKAQRERASDLYQQIDRLKSEMTEGQGEIVHRTPVVENDQTGNMESKEFRLRKLTPEQTKEKWPDVSTRHDVLGGYEAWVAESRRVYYDREGKTIEKRDPWYMDAAKATREGALEEAGAYSGRTSKMWKEIGKTESSKSKLAPLSRGQTEISQDQAMAISGGRKALLPKPGESFPQLQDSSKEYFIGQTEDGRFYTEHRPGGGPPSGPVGPGMGGAIPAEARAADTYESLKAQMVAHEEAGTVPPASLKSKFAKASIARAEAENEAPEWTSATEEKPAKATKKVKGTPPESDLPSFTGTVTSGIPIPKWPERHMSQLDKVTASHSAKLQASMDEARRAQKDFRKAVPSERKQAAISVWLEAKGDIATLEGWESAAKGKMFKRAATDAQTLTAKEIDMAAKARSAFDTLHARGTALEVLNSHRDAYVPHVWEVDATGKGAGWGTSTLKQRFKFAKARTFANFFEGDQAGYTPKTLEIGKLLPAYLHEMNKVVADRQFVKDLIGKTAKDGRPLVIPRGNAKTVDTTEWAVVDKAGGRAKSLHESAEEAQAAAQAIPGAFVEERPKSTAFVAPRNFATAKDATGAPIEQGDYKTMEGQPALSKWTWVESDPLGGTTMLQSDLSLHPEAYRRLNAMLGQSALRTWAREQVGGMAQVPRAIAHGLDVGQSAMKREMFGLLAPFHQVQEGTHAIGHMVNPFYGIPKVDFRNPAMADAAKHGLMLLPDRTSAEVYMEGVGTKSSLTSRGIRKLGPVGRAVSDVVDGYQDYLFHQYIPGLKFKTYEAMVGRNTKLYAKELARGEMTRADVKLVSAEQANAAYGHLNYALLDRNPTMQHLIQLAALAPDFLEARVRFAGQGIKGLTGGKGGVEQFKAIAILAAVQAGSAFVMSSLLGSKYDPQHPFEVVYKGRRYFLRSVPEDIYAMLKDTRQFIYGRINPLTVKGPVQLGTGLNYRGEKVTPLETITELLAGYIPITARQIPGVRSLTETSRQSSTTPLEQLAGSLGLRISRYSPISETHKNASAWMEAQKMPREKGSYPVSKFTQMRYALEDGDMDRAMASYRELLKTENAMKLYGGFKESLMKPFTGSLENDKKFAASLSGYDRELYDLAKRRRSEIWTRFMKLRGMPLKQATPAPVVPVPGDA
jgi:hypothetical protein